MTETYAASSPRKPARDEGPWYRQPWPWLLMSMPATAVVAGFVTLWIAIKTDDGLVTGDYYKQGLAINKTLARERRAAELRAEAHIKLSEGRLDVALRIPAPPQAIRIKFIHPSGAAADQTLLLTGHNGEYAGAIKDLTKGRWLVDLEDDAQTWRLAGTMKIPQDREIKLDSSSLQSPE
ncbi:MAG: FixH family protein [Rhodocyclaceae bacterium]|nr:FixH family protein [Rhodocyclaceae bacterium]